MKTGKVPENVLKRAVLKQLRTKRPEVILGAGIGEDCAALKLAPDETLVMSTDPITGTINDIGTLAIQITLNDLASSGAEPFGVMLTVLLPKRARESQLKKIMEQVGTACAGANIQVMGGHTEVTAAVNQPLICVCGVGKAKDNAVVTTGGAKPGMDLLVTKWIGIEGTSILAKDKQTELSTRFSSSFLATAQNFDTYISVLPEAKIAVKFGVAAMHDVTEGGIFGALWEMAEASGTGLEIDLKKIPIRQETIEICEFFDINPYKLISSGCMLMASSDGTGLLRELTKAKIPAAIIGKATADNDRVLLNGEERRFLEPPDIDELYQAEKGV